MTITLATLPQASEQEVFDQVARHLLTQGKQSIDSDEVRCMYRSGSLKCAAGCLIGDDEYQPEMEGWDWSALVSKGKAPGTNLTLIIDLQCLHDRVGGGRWCDELRYLAESNSLSPAVLEEFSS